MTQMLRITSNEAQEKERKKVLRLELDYELATLFEAMNKNDEQLQKSCKEKLNKIREELICLNAF